MFGLPTWQTIEDTTNAMNYSLVKSSVQIELDGVVPFVIRIGHNIDSQVLDQKKTISGPLPDVFREPHTNELFICDIKPNHCLMINKYSLVKGHLLIVTAEYAPQSDPLTELELKIACQAVLQWNGLVYFNCGPESGASQPHKHLQFVPLPLSDKIQYDIPIQPLIENEEFQTHPAWEPFSNTHMKFVNYICKFDSDLTPYRSKDLFHLYNNILNSAAQLLKKNDFSYNLILTSKWMLVVPRKFATLPSTNISLNSIAYTGTIFAKNHNDLNFILQQTPMKLLGIAAFDQNS